MAAKRDARLGGLVLHVLFLRTLALSLLQAFFCAVDGPFLPSRCSE